MPRAYARPIGPRRSESSIPSIRKGGRRKKRQPAGPYRSESSIPSIRNPGVSPTAKPPTHPGLYHALGLIPSRYESPSTGLNLPNLLGISERQGVAQDQRGGRASALLDVLEAIGKTRKAPSTLEALEIASLGIPGVGFGLGAKGVRGGLLAEKLLSASRAIKASESAAVKAGAKAVFRRGVVRSAAGRAATKIEPEASAALRRAAAARAARVASHVPKPVRTAGKVAGRVAGAPIKHPFTAPVAAQIPAAALGGGPDELLKPLSGGGVLASIGNAAGEAVASAVPGRVAQNLVKDAFNLPAQVLPSVYLPLAGAVEASQGDSSRLRGLWKDYMDSGAIPALARGDAEAALKAVEAHPLFTALEVSGAAAVAGRGAGAIARNATKGRVGGLERPPLTIEGYPNVKPAREYSRDLIRQGIQRARDRRTGSKIDPATFLGRQRLRHVLRNEAADRFASNADQIRRQGKLEALKAASGLVPKKKVLGVFKRMDHASANVVSHAIERLVQHPETFHEDLSAYLRKLDEIHRSGKLNKAEAAANRALAKDLKAGIAAANPEHVVEAANAFIQAHAPIVQELVERGILSPEQAAKAAAIPFARTHMGAGYKEGVGVTDAQGRPLSLEQITAEMQRRGIEPAGFLSHRAPTRGDWYSPWYPERGSLPKGPRGVRTGEAVARGLRQGNFEAVVTQLVRSRGLLDRVKTWDRFITRFGVGLDRAGVKNMGDAYKVLQDPGRYGLNPSIDWVPVRRHPFIALKSEIQGALEHQHPEIAQESLLSKALGHAVNDNTHEGGPIVFMPAMVVKRIGEHFTPSGSGIKAMQLASTAFKRAVLPLSPSFYYGNIVDNMIRTALAGVGPVSLYQGYQLSKHMTADQRAELLSGAGYSSVERLAVRRTAEDFADTAFEPFAQAMAHLRATPGLKQSVDVFNAVSHALLQVNSRLTEMLPQYGALGKIAIRDIRAVQGHWSSALRIQPEVLKMVAQQRLTNPDIMIRYQKEIEAIYGNWVRMGPAARKVLSNFAPFWMWTRAASRYVLFTMPGRHPIQTALIAAAAEMTQEERAKFGLDKFAGDAPLPAFLQGGLPIRGGISSWGKYSSFGVFGDYPAFLARTFGPQFSSLYEALQGRDWKGQPIADASGRAVDEPTRVVKAFEAAAPGFIPGFNLLSSLATGDVGKLSPFYVYRGDKLGYLRSLSNSQQITVPASGSSSSTGTDYSRIATGGGGSTIDYSKVAGGG